MSIILVYHRPTESKYMWLSASSETLAAVCDAAGAIRHLPTEELTVLEVDGRPLDRYRRILESPERESENPLHDAHEGSVEACPGCDTPVRSDERECPSCGLTLILEP